MSNSLAIATVTTALAQIARTAAESAVAGAQVTVGRPENPTNGTLPRVRLYLFQVTPNAALRNADLPTRAASGQLTQRPQAALDLHYLLAFYGNENELEPQRMMGAVVRDLHAQPVLTRQAIQNAIASQAVLTNSNLAEAVELVKFTPIPLSLEELSKLWSVFFQTPHALSVAYQGAVVLIESEERAQPAPPVLRRGAEDRGPDTLLGPFPTLEGIHIGAPEDKDLRPRPPSYPAAQLGHLVTISGRNLGGDTVLVRFMHQRLALQEDLTVAEADRTATEISVTTPNDVAAQTDWAAGLYGVAVISRKQSDERTTNIVPLPLAPRITQILPSNTIQRDASGNVTLTIKFSPFVVVGKQKVTLLLADRELSPEPFPAPAPATADTLSFVVTDAPQVNNALVILRVDGVDSLPFMREKPPDKPPRLVFDPSQQVTIT